MIIAEDVWARRLGLWFGPEAEGHQWDTAARKYDQRVRQVRATAVWAQTCWSCTTALPSAPLVILNRAARTTDRRLLWLEMACVARLTRAPLHSLRLKSTGWRCSGVGRAAGSAPRLPAALPTTMAGAHRGRLAVGHALLTPPASSHRLLSRCGRRRSSSTICLRRCGGGRAGRARSSSTCGRLGA